MLRMRSRSNGKEEAMRYHCAISMMLALAGGTATASAAFTGFTAVYGGTVSGRDVYRVLAVFNQADDVIVNLQNFQTLAGSQSTVYHNDSSGMNGGVGGWDPAYTMGGSQSSSDSYVSINGAIGSASVTSLVGFGSGMGIPNGAGWASSSSSPITVGSLQYVTIAQFVGSFSGGKGFIAGLNIGYRESATAPIYTAYGTFQIGTIPAPGALALLGLAGLGRSRRR